MSNHAIELYKSVLEFAYTNIGEEPTSKSFFDGIVAGKFAELIVQDCIAQCKNVGNVIDATYDGEEAYRFKSVADTCEKMIKQRFGIEQ